jgi:hypothetical protein
LVKRVRRVPDCDQSPKKEGKSIVAKDAAKDYVDRTIVNRCIDCVYMLINEGRHAEAVSFLFFLHKTHLTEWVHVKRGLLANALSHRELSVTSDLLNASKASTLSESAHIFPGLSDLIKSCVCRELLN